MDNKKRNLDGVYFRVERDGKFDNVCFSDLTLEEMEIVLNEKTEEWLRSLCKILVARMVYIYGSLDMNFSYAALEEIDNVVNHGDAPWLQKACITFGEIVRKMGDQFDIAIDD